MGDKCSKSAVAVVEPTHGSLSSKDYEFLATQTGMSHGEIKKVFDDFYVMNPSGKLNREQFSRLYCMLLTKKECNEKLNKICEQIFQCFDSNNDNSIDFYEFMLGFSITTHGDARKKLEFAFNMYDRDHNRSIDELEILKIIKGMHTLLGLDNVDEFIDKCMSVLDVSKDGVISRDEFINGLIKNKELREHLMPFDC